MECGVNAWQNKVTGELSPWYCGRLSCSLDKCGKIFVTRRVKLLQSLVDEYNLRRFFTLTLDRSKVEEHDAWCQIPHIWSKMRKRLKRVSGDFRFCSVLEAHKDDRWPHIHGFTNIWLPQNRWSDMWSSCGGGKIVDVRYVRDSVQVGEYVSKQIEVYKYVGKQQILGAEVRKQGRVTLWRSQKMRAKFELDKQSDWCILEARVYNNGELTPEFRRKYHGKKDKQVATSCCTVSQACY